MDSRCSALGLGSGTDDTHHTPCDNDLNTTRVDKLQRQEQGARRSLTGVP
jgi:hypothetical protein